MRLTQFLLIGLLSTSLYAATTWTGAIDNDFSNAGNWDNGAPGSTDGVAIINNGDSAFITSNYSGTNPYTLAISGNSTLTSSADFSSTALNIASGSTVNLTGGSYTLPQTSTNNNTDFATAVNGTLDITGGSHQFNERLGGSGSINVTGSAPTLSNYQIASFSGTFNLTLDAAGINTNTSLPGFSWYSLTGASLVVDGSAYTGGPGTITLFDGHAAGNTFDSAKVTITGLGTEGVDYNFIQTNPSSSDGGRDLVQIQIIPEPSSASLFALGALALLGRKRK